MVLPAKIEYAYKAILELALRYKEDSPIQLSVLCRSQGIPQNFLIQILLQLKNAGIVNSARGIAGGYYLARPPSEISLADIFKAVDDTILAGQNKARKPRSGEAENLLFRIWDEVGRDAERRLAEVTLDKIVSKIKNQQLVYYI